MTAAIGLTVAVWQVAVLRAFAWVSRGIRSPARDMLLTDLSARDSFGRAFGVERAGDNVGAIIGLLLAAALVSVIGIRQAMLVSIVPVHCHREGSAGPVAQQRVRGARVDAGVR